MVQSGSSPDLSWLTLVIIQIAILWYKVSFPIFIASDNIEISFRIYIVIHYLDL